MKNKILSMLLIISMGLYGLTGCGSTESSTDNVVSDNTNEDTYDGDDSVESSTDNVVSDNTNEDTYDDDGYDEEESDEEESDEEYNAIVDYLSYIDYFLEQDNMRVQIVTNFNNVIPDYGEPIRSEFDINYLADCYDDIIHIYDGDVFGEFHGELNKENLTPLTAKVSGTVAGKKSVCRFFMEEVDNNYRYNFNLIYPSSFQCGVRRVTNDNIKHLSLKKIRKLLKSIKESLDNESYMLEDYDTDEMEIYFNDNVELYRFFRDCVSLAEPNTASVGWHVLNFSKSSTWDNLAPSIKLSYTDDYDSFSDDYENDSDNQVLFSITLDIDDLCILNSTDPIGGKTEETHNHFQLNFLANSPEHTYNNVELTEVYGGGQRGTYIEFTDENGYWQRYEVSYDKDMNRYYYIDDFDNKVLASEDSWDN